MYMCECYNLYTLVKISPLIYRLLFYEIEDVKDAVLTIRNYLGNSVEGSRRVKGVPRGESGT